MEKYKFKVKPRKICGVVSQVLILPCIESIKLPIGTDVTKLMGVSSYFDSEIIYESQKTKHHWFIQNKRLRNALMEICRCEYML